MRFLGAEIGQLVSSDARLHNPDGLAMNAEQIRVIRDVVLGKEFVAGGTVSFANAQLGRSLECDGATFVRIRRR